MNEIIKVNVENFVPWFELRLSEYLRCELKNINFELNGTVSCLVQLRAQSAFLR